jgi:death-on-curing protein
LWLPLEAVTTFNRQQVELTGEHHALLFPERLEGALMRHHNSFYYEGNSNTVSLGVNLMISVAAAHAFEQGNKRTGFVSGVVFLHINGYELDERADHEELAALFTKTITGKADAVTFERMLKDWIFPIGSAHR